MAKEGLNNGFVKLYRSFTEWQHYGEPSVKVVFLDLLLNANHKKGWFKGVSCGRGETFASIRTLAESNGLSTKTVQRALNILEDTGEIKRIKVSQKLTKTIILKYSQYQDISGFSVVKCDTQTTTQSTTQTTTEQEEEEGKNIIVENNTPARTNNNNNIIKELMSHTYLLEGFCMTEHITLQQCQELAEAVVNEWELTDEPDKGRKHLLNAIRAKAQAMQEQGTLLTGSIEERKKAFLDECKKLMDKGCNRDEVARFARYYTQPTADGRLLFETYKGWDTETRFLLNSNK